MFKPRTEQWHTKKIAEYKDYFIVNLYIRGQPICDQNGNPFEYAILRDSAYASNFLHMVQRILRNS